MATGRIIIALGARRSTLAVPALLDVDACVSDDTKLGETLAWALAYIGEAALLPLYAFASRRAVPHPARALAITTLGHISDPRLSTILNHSWREYRFEESCLAMASLLGVTVSGLGDEAYTRALETPRLWWAQRSLRDMGFESAVSVLHYALENTRTDDSLPTWSSVGQELGR